MNRYIFTAIILFLSYYIGYGQISTLEEPLSFRTNIPTLLRTSEQVQKYLPTFDINRLQQEDRENDANGGVPFRFGYKHRVNYNLENSGEWMDLPCGGRLWQLTISSPGAQSINLLYNEFWLPAVLNFGFTVMTINIALVLLRLQTTKEQEVI